jgi:hypothetical protein
MPQQSKALQPIPKARCCCLFSDPYRCDCCPNNTSMTIWRKTSFRASW